ncbi:MAG: NAD(P)/FAD-dependent oxidoreductase, partial [Acidobacteriales bacterium]|nr:NAD(P)/FAD-dependent oxidoreductase [Terriglobales bacterium]
MTQFDLAVVGAGPGGIAAATIAAEAGLRVCLLDDNRSPGGQIWRGLRSNESTKSPHGREYRQWSERLRRTSCEIWTGSQVIDHPGANTLRQERDGEVRDLTYGQLVLATGARERFLPFPGWTLPGVAGAGGLQALVKTGLDVRGKRVVVAGTGPLLLAIAAGLKDAGSTIVAIYEQAPLLELARFGLTLAAFPAKIIEGFGYARELRGIPYRPGCLVTSADGPNRLARITVTDGRTQWMHDCDWLACGYHLVPNLELPLLLGCAVSNGYVTVDQFQQSSVSSVACVGELTGIGGLDKALIEGEIAGWFAGGRRDKAMSLSARRNKQRSFARRLQQAFALRDELRHLCSPETIVCRCEDVAYSTMRQCGSWREAKLHRRCGMGACQGRICGP